MAELLLNLYRVPADEADAVRTLLTEHGIAFYETEPHWLGISHGGIWVREKAEHERAKALLDEFQARRRDSARAAWRKARRSGEAPGFWRQILSQPMRALLLLVALLLVLLIVVLPAWLLLG